MVRKLFCTLVLVAVMPGVAAANSCGTVQFVAFGTHVESAQRSIRFPVFLYHKNSHHAVVIKQDMRVNADGAVRSYAVDGHGFSYLCDGLTWKSPTGFTNQGACPTETAKAMQLAHEQHGSLHFSPTGPTLCVFGFHVTKEKVLPGCKGTVVGGGMGGEAPLVHVPTSSGSRPHFVATTAVKNTDARAGTPEHEIDAARIPFIVRPGTWESKFPSATFDKRDYAYIHASGNLGVPGELLHGARGVFALVGDTGPSNKFGEGSLALHQFLAFGELRPAPDYIPTPRGQPHPQANHIFHPYMDKGDGDVRAKRNINRELWYVIFPQSADTTAQRHTYEKVGERITGNIQDNGIKAAQALGGIETIIACLAQDGTFRQRVRQE